MKKQVLILLLVAIAGTSSYAQCDKKNVLTGSSTEYLNASSELQRSVDETTTIEYDAKSITITPGDHSMSGTISSIVCDWKIPYKEGKSVIKASVEGPNGQFMTTTITIEGKDGKVTLLFEADEFPDRKIRLSADKYEEKK